MPCLPRCNAEPSHGQLFPAYDRPQYITWEQDFAGMNNVRYQVSTDAASAALPSICRMRLSFGTMDTCHTVTSKPQDCHAVGDVRDAT